jgi:hypothetical protein
MAIIQTHVRHDDLGGGMMAGAEAGGGGCMTSVIRVDIMPN